MSMMVRLKHGVLIGFCAVFSLIGWYTYCYFFDTSMPVIAVSGIDVGGYYCDDAQCGVTASKKGRMSVWLDGQPLLTDFSVSSVNEEQPFTIPSRAIANGDHSLRIEFVDATYRKNKVAVDRIFYVDNM